MWTDADSIMSNNVESGGWKFLLETCSLVLNLQNLLKQRTSFK